MLAQDRADRELEQRLAAGHEVADGGVARAQPQVAGVLPVRRDAHERLRGEALVAVERLERGGLARGVAVEGVDDLAAVERVVAHQPADHADVLGAEGRAAGGDGRGHAGQVHGHDVGVALDDDDLPALGDLPLGQVQPEEHVRLAVDRRLGGVEVLGLDRVVVDRSGVRRSRRRRRRGRGWARAGGGGTGRSGRAGPPCDRPAFISSSRVNPAASRCLVSASQPAGAKPQPKCWADAASNPREVRNRTAGAASGVCSAAA